MKNSISIDGHSLTIDDVVLVADKYSNVSIDDNALVKVEHSSEIVKKIVQENHPVYGINTGFGKLADVVIGRDELSKLQQNLILSHSSGVGESFTEREVRAAILVRVNSLAKGNSGIRKETLEKLVEILNKKIYPYVPLYGSVGASGDLAPLAHIALLLLGKGRVFKDDKIVEFEEVAPLYEFKSLSEFAPKEGLALINGTSFEAGVSSLLVSEAEYLLDIAIKSFALSFEALRGLTAPFDDRIHVARNSDSQKIISEKFLRIIKNSKLVNTSYRVQDAYTLRCMPQVYGAVFENINYIKSFLEKEINSSTDNPLIFEDGSIISGGNFHAQPLSFLMDLYSIVLTSMSSMIERRINRLLNPVLSGLKPFLANNPGVESGMMILQYTAASLVSENKTLSHPASVDSIPVSADQEDFVSMGMNAVLKARKVLDNVRKVLAIELIIGAQALEMVLQEIEDYDSVGIGTKEIFTKVRSIVPFANKDRIFSYDIELVERALKAHLF
ncbi:histidine ammonia-lyase [Caldisericum exile]|uniref:Histidine ammonia-lyase n=1 Tax=Caldisericum exile (strain DSM 21853 / NBRC 104410 / AZM16c01) TaxID=511051 RepID=A0A7U6JFR7_CALEA|nr:histidine ammonia-lyase [Caldisericum exile]BAL80510.1 histidine ammonia-lyase [Caldisericum exile AZM16c01]